MNGADSREHKRRTIPTLLWAVVPVVLLAGVIAWLATARPLESLSAGVPPAELLSLDRLQLKPGHVHVGVFNGGPSPVTIGQVMVDDAYWHFDQAPDGPIPRLGQATLHLDYPWVRGEPLSVRVITSTGLTFDAGVEAAFPSPLRGGRALPTLALVGVLVGVVPVVLGLLWVPALKRMRRDVLNAILGLTVGLLAFLLVDTLLEAFEIAGDLPGVVQGRTMVLLSGLLTWLALLAVGSRRRAGATPDRLYVAALIALGIGLHNLGEGLAIGAAFAVGEAALASFLVLGFTLHNLTEGIGIAAPLVSRGQDDAAPSSPRVVTLALLALLAGGPAIVGVILGGYAYSPVLAALFLGIGAGAIWQVIFEVVRLMRGPAGGLRLGWAEALGIAAGVGLMYVTAFLVH